MAGAYGKMKLTNFVLIITGLMILFSLAGINTSAGYALGTLGLGSNPTGFVGGSLYLLIIGVFAVAAAGSVIIGLFAKAPVENLLIAPLMLFFVLFLGDLTLIIKAADSACGVGSSCRWVYNIVLVLIAPLIIAFVMALIDWWRGRD